MGFSRLQLKGEVTGGATPRPSTETLREDDDGAVLEGEVGGYTCNCVILDDCRFHEMPCVTVRLIG
jgi:hypothetical protein